MPAMTTAIPPCAKIIPQVARGRCKARRNAPRGSAARRTRSASSVIVAAKSHAASANPQAAPIECAPVAAKVTNAAAAVTTNATFNRDNAA